MKQIEKQISEADGQYIHEDAEKNENEELLPQNPDNEGDNKDNIHYGMNDIHPKARRRLLNCKLKESRQMIQMMTWTKT